jgi:hypothetical protein
MQQTEILSISERLISAYHAEDFELVFNQVTKGESPSTKLLVKMELNRLMATSVSICVVAYQRTVTNINWTGCPIGSMIGHSTPITF